MISEMYIHLYRAPPPSQWGKKYKRGGLVAQISNKLKIGQGSSQEVRDAMEKAYHKLLKRHLNGDDVSTLNIEIDLSHAKHDYTSQMKIKLGSRYELVAYELIGDGNSFELVADLVSIEMMDDGLEEGISQSAICSMLN